jgi:hypothetical protein
MTNSLIGQYVIVRSSPSGCWAGTLQTMDGNTVTLTDARRLWRWWAAKGVSLSGVAAAGLHPKHLKDCRIAEPVSTAIVLEVCEVLSTTDEAKASITGAEAIAA